MEGFVIFVTIISLLIWLLSTLYTLFVSSPYKRDDNADFGEIDFEKAKQELKGRLEYPYCESATINESGILELVCKYATYSVNIQDRKLVIESDPRPFVKPGNVVEEKDCLEAYLVKTLLPETDSNPPKALEHFQRYVQFCLLRRISGWLFLALLILCALNESGLSVINVMDVWKSKGVSQMCFTDYSEEVTIGEALRAACSNCKWQSDKIGDNLYTVTFNGYGADGSLLTILFQTNRSECSIESITLDQKDITWTQGLFLAALYESIKDDDGDDEELTLPETMNENMFGDADGIISNDINNDTEDIQNDLSYGLNEAASVELNDGGQISVTFTKYGEKENIAYINYEIENIGNTSVTVGESMFSVYANDYAAELNFGENTIYEETISVGRKVSGTLYPNMLLDKVKKLEIECGDVIFLLRDTSTVDAMLGTYYRQYEEEGNIVIDEIKLYREAYNNEGLAVSTKHHIDFGNEYDYDYDFNSWVFELYDDKIEFINHGSYMEGLTVYYSRNPREEGIDVVQSENSEIEDMFTGHYEWTDNIQAVYELVENAKQTEKSILTDDEELYDSEVQGFSSQYENVGFSDQPNGSIDYVEAYSSIVEEICHSYEEYEYCEYTLYDLDGDGIKELITSEGTCDADWSNVVYTLEDGCVSMIGQFYGSVMLYVAEDGNGLYAVSGGMEYQNIDQITKNGNQLQVETIMSGEIGVEEDYYSNDNPISFTTVTDDSLLKQ